jgi:FKBP-type peptidyl-prolyl cis-trans isomerase
MTNMRSFLPLTVLILCLTPVTMVFSQNNLPPADQPAGPGPGAEAAPGALPGALPGAPGAAPEDPNYRAQVSYALGRNFATNLKENGIDCDLNALMAGISDALSGAQPKWNEQQLDAVLQKFGREMQQKQMTKMQQVAMKNQQEATNFLSQNGKREGVQTTPSGLQFRVVQQGQGPSPTLTDTVKCNYKGTLLNGTEFDSSARQGGPAEFPVKRVIPGWTEALQKMHVGDKWQLFVPAKLAYGMNPPPDSPIEAGSLLVFEIELLDIVKQ